MDGDIWFVWAEGCFLVNDHINMMIPFSYPTTHIHTHILLVLPLSFSFPLTLCDSAGDADVKRMPNVTASLIVVIFCHLHPVIVASVWVRA